MTRRNVFALLISLVGAGGLLAVLVLYAGTGDALPLLAASFLERSIADAATVNVVSTVLLDYRAFDTLGEATVIFASVTGVSALFVGAHLTPKSRGAGILVERAIGYLAAFFWLFPVYIVLFGHLSPGGGFQGGVALAVLIILLNVVYGTERGSTVMTTHRLHLFEDAGALAFLLIGAVGIVQGSAFLANLAAGFPGGSPGSLLSAGAIPLLNLAIGIKVASGLATIFYEFLSTWSTTGSESTE